MKKVTKFPRVSGRFLRNNLELSVYHQLKGILPKGAVLSYETKKVPYYIESTYYPDFIIERKGQKDLIIETKGFGRAFDQQARAKMVAVRKQHPDLDIRIVFSSDAKLTKGGKMRASDWALKYGFPFAIGKVPEEWLE